MTVAVIIQARMTSTRLPGKVMLPLGGKPVLWHVIRRCEYIEGVDQVILAIPEDSANDCIVDFWPGSVRGPEHDVLARFWQVALAFPHDHYMRITADCPLIDPEVCGAVLKLHLDSWDCDAYWNGSVPGNDYTSNVHPRGWPKGLDCEVFTHEALEMAARQTRLHPDDPTHKEDSEHVTPWMVRVLKNKGNLENPDYQEGLEDYRLTLDTPADYEFMKTLFRVVS